jgi:hypothetical protein
MMNSTPSIGRVVICDNDLCRSCVGMLLGCEVLGGEAASVELYSQ